MSLLLKNRNSWILLLSISGITLHLLLRWVHLPGVGPSIPLLTVIILGGIPLAWEIFRDILRGKMGADALAALSIVVAAVLKQYLAGAIVVFMLASGDYLEEYAVGHASSVLKALLKRMPTVAHKKSGSALQEIALADINPGDILVVFPHETAPVDGVVVEGHGAMDESYLTGEPYQMSKSPGAEVFSGAINGESALTIEATRRAVDSRYAKVMEVMKEAEQKKPHLRRLGDQLGAFYTPVALAVAGAAWWFSGEPQRFLAVLVVATPCPLIIAIPVAILGAISLAAKRSIIVKNPAALEQIQQCRTAIFDKTGTLTYGEAVLVAEEMLSDDQPDDILRRVASLERFSRHPLARALQKAADARHLPDLDVSEIHETAGQGLSGVVAGQPVRVVGRKQLPGLGLSLNERANEPRTGLECFVVINGRLAARYQFRDTPRTESAFFIRHLGPRHSFDRQMIVTGDRESEARYSAEEVGLAEVFAGKSPEEKLAIVRAETARGKTLYIGDGINDAPALMAATVGMAIGPHSDVASEAASVVVLESSLRRVDEFMHIGERMRRVALQSAVGGMALSLIGMGAAAAGHLTPVAGAILQEVIDLLAILNAIRAAYPPRILSDL